MLNHWLRSVSLIRVGGGWLFQWRLDGLIFEVLVLGQTPAATQTPVLYVSERGDGGGVQRWFFKSVAISFQTIIAVEGSQRGCAFFSRLHAGRWLCNLVVIQFTTTTTIQIKWFRFTKPLFPTFACLLCGVQREFLSIIFVKISISVLFGKGLRGSKQEPRKFAIIRGYRRITAQTSCRAAWIENNNITGPRRRLDLHTFRRWIWMSCGGKRRRSNRAWSGADWTWLAMGMKCRELI